MNWRNAFFASLLVVPLIWLLAQGFGRDPRAVPSVLENRPAPSFKLVDVKGTPLSLDELRGRPIVMNFWSTWCEPCKEEHALLQQAAKFYEGRVQFLGVVYQDSDEAVRSYLGRHSSTYPQLLDPEARVAIDYGVSGVPESFFIDPQGTLRVKHVGVLSFDVLRTHLDAMLKSGSKS